MGRFRHDEVDNYGGGGSGSFFSLANDKDTARVRFLYNGVDDVEGIACHEVEIDGKKRYVNCLREYNQPVSACPFCEAGKYQAAKLFIPLYDVDEDKVKVWERGKTFFSKLTSVCARYPKLVSHIFEIERNGKAKDPHTTYEIYEVERDDTKLEDLPEAPQIIGGLVLDKSADELRYYLDHNEFPDSNDGGDDRRDDRRSSRSSRESSDGRRTPASSSRRERF